MNTFEISTNGSDRKEIIKVILKKCFSSSNLIEFKKNIIAINSTCNNLVKSNILYESADYLLISRFKSNNKLQLMNERELKKYFDKNGTLFLLKTLIKILKIFHQNNFYHGGIKLSNIMIKEENQYEICDYFYLLLNKRELDTSNTNVEYISPEELLSKKCDISKDMWNIGILLYKILSGKYPFEDKTLIDRYNNILHTKFNDLEIEYSELLNLLLHKLLVKKRKSRISITEFEKEIDKINSVPNLKVEIFQFIEEDEKEVKEVKFLRYNKHKDISIIEDNKTVKHNTGIPDVSFPHCFLNVQMSEDIHHFLFKVQHGCDKICFGCTSNSKYNGKDICEDKSSCSIVIYSEYSYLYGSNGDVITNSELTHIYEKEEEEYEVKFNMNKKTMSIEEKDGKEILLFTNIKTPVYPFVCVSYKDSINLMKYWKEDSSNTKGGILSWFKK